MASGFGPSHRHGRASRHSGEGCPGHPRLLLGLHVQNVDARHKAGHDGGEAFRRGPMAQSIALRIGTRGSPLALAQAREVRARLAAAHGIDAAAIELRAIRTSGDMVQDRPLTEIGGKGLFTKEIDQALIDGTVDLAVHSAKDLPTVLPLRLAIAGYLTREDARDAFISRKARRLS